MKPKQKHVLLFGAHLKRRMDKAFASIQAEEFAYIDIEIIKGEIDALALRIPLSIKDIASGLNINLTEMVNLILCNFHNQMNGNEESLMRELQKKDPDFIRRFIAEFKLSLKEITSET
jgi:hypothetical protein